MTKPINFIASDGQEHGLSARITLSSVPLNHVLLYRVCKALIESRVLKYHLTEMIDSRLGVSGHMLQPTALAICYTKYECYFCFKEIN